MLMRFNEPETGLLHFTEGGLAVTRRGHTSGWLGVKTSTQGSATPDLPPGRPLLRVRSLTGRDPLPAYHSPLPKPAVHHPEAPQRLLSQKEEEEEEGL